MANDLLEPLSLYNKTLKNEIHQHADELFEELVKKANVDVEANKKTVANYKKTLVELANAKKQASKTKTLKGFIVFLIVMLFIAAIIFIYFAVENKYFELYINIIVASATIGIAIGLIILLVKKINKKLKAQEDICQKLDDKAQKYLAEAQAQMKVLNSLFDWNAHVEILRRTTDTIKVDSYFNIERFQYLHDKYDLNDEVDLTISTEHIMSGEIVGNPFLLVRQFHQTVGTKTYYGSLTISWVETYRDSEGHIHTTTRTQVLHASVIKPAPYYHKNTFLVYGNDAAPDLNFSRSSSQIGNLSDKEIRKKIKQGEKDLKKKAEKGVSSTGFTRLSNTEFDVLFGATNRDNEVQFRLLFTPLAQKSMLELIRSKAPYGDDFSFKKQGPLNFICSNHSQTQDYEGKPTRYMSYDLATSKKEFIQYNEQLIQSLYFDLAPLLAIPLYQQFESDEYIYQNTYERNYTSYEEEVLANAFDPNIFKHPNAITSSILKAYFVNKYNGADLISIHAFAFKGVDRIDYVPVLGGDGHTHNVPVPWIEYIPVENTTLMVVRSFDGTKADFDSVRSNPLFQNFVAHYGINSLITYQRGLFALLVSDYSSEINDELTNIIKQCRI